MYCIALETRDCRVTHITSAHFWLVIDLNFNPNHVITKNVKGNVHTLAMPDIDIKILRVNRSN